MKPAVNNENRPLGIREHITRITRSRAKVLGSSGGLPPLYPSAKQDDKQVVRANSKRAASNKHGPNSAAYSSVKKRAVLKDVTNVACENIYISCIGATRGQPTKQVRRCSMRGKRKIEPASFTEQSLPEREQVKGEANKVELAPAKETSPAENVIIEQTELISQNMPGATSLIPNKTNCIGNVTLPIPSRKDCAEDFKLGKKQESLEDKGITDIDSKNQDPLMCSLYAADIYSIMHATQLDRRPLVNYMDKMQRDITPGMRSVLIDWLIEVSEEYKLVPDTIYLTVNLIDRFLSVNHIEKKKLQLLGITCMLIASKYEEICAPCVEEFCVITDNTYTKEEVVKMESCVLNSLDFRLSVPTTKKFLRRFIHAAQDSYKAPSIELEFLANYLAELALIDYTFVKFVPSVLAASAVFLARWTLDQSDYPWNPTLEHYTRHCASELKMTVLELQDLHLNTKGCKLNAIREKYKQSKFKRVSTLKSEKDVGVLF